MPWLWKAGLTPVIFGWLDVGGAPCFCAFSLGIWKVDSEKATWDGPALKGLIAVLLGEECQCVLFWAKLPCVSQQAVARTFYLGWVLQGMLGWQEHDMWSVLLHPSDKFDWVNHTWLWAKFKWTSVFQVLRSWCRIPVVKLLWSSGTDSRDVCLWCLQPKVGICAGFLEVIHPQRWHHLT